MLIVSCGGESDPATNATDAATTAAPPNLDKYLLQADEVPGLEPMSSPQTAGAPFDLPKNGVERLRRSGYIWTPSRPIRAA